MQNTTQSNILYAQSNGQASSNPFVDVFSSRDPTTNDINFPVQKKWWNFTDERYWILEGFTTTLGVVSANWKEITSPGTSSVVKIGVDHDVPPGTNPVLPDGSGGISVTGGQVAAGTTTNVIRTDSVAANQFTIEVQRSQAVASSTVGDNGVCHFNSSQFTVDSNGFVGIVGGQATTSLGVDVHTPPGTSPVVPNGSGVIAVTGGQVAAGTTTNVIRTDSLAANQMIIEIQRSQAAASTTVGDNGVCHFDSAYFTVDSNGFVSSSSTPTKAFFNKVVQQVITSTGTYTPTAGMKYCYIRCLGGGGAGGGGATSGLHQSSSGGGGGAGEYAEGVFSAATIGVSQSVTIGAGGVGASGVDGGNGGNTSVGALISANGGSGGITSAVSLSVVGVGGEGGTGGSGGDLRSPGAAGVSAPAYSGFFVMSGQGANSQFGSGGAPGTGGGSGGNPGTGYGSGGSGYITSDTSEAAGGDGAPGVVVITEYLSV